MNDCKQYQSQKISTATKVDIYIQLGNSLLELGNEEQAEKAYRTAVAIAKRESGTNSGLTGCALAELWIFYDRIERIEEAGEIWQQLVEIVRARYVEVIDPNFG